MPSTSWGIPDLASNIGDVWSAEQANKRDDIRTSEKTSHDDMMANTKYQRGVDDMRLAGLNPILAAGSPAGESSMGISSAHQAAQAGTVAGPTSTSPVEASIARSQATSAQAAADRDSTVADFYRKNPKVAAFLDVTKGHDDISSAAAAAALWGGDVPKKLSQAATSASAANDAANKAGGYGIDFDSHRHAIQKWAK